MSLSFTAHYKRQHTATAPVAFVGELLAERSARINNILNSPHFLLNENVQCTYWAYVFSDPTGVLTIKIVQNPHILPLGLCS
jgi:hypothetical protein